MPFYLVGTAETIFPKSTNSSIVKQFTEEGIRENLTKTKNLRLFTDLGFAREYARSLREGRTVKDQGTKFAPVVRIESKNTDYQLSKQEQTERIEVQRYQDIEAQFPNDKYSAVIKFFPTDEHFNLNNFELSSLEFPDSNFDIIYLNPSSLPFFRALNPASENSGITYRWAKGVACQDKEMLDYSVGESISKAYKKNYDFFPGVSATFEILMGDHYDMALVGKWNNKGGRKGALDYFILPLIARKLIADTYLEERKETPIKNILAFSIAVPLELIRFGAAFALTLLLAPIVGFVTLIRKFSQEKETMDLTTRLMTPSR